MKRYARYMSILISATLLTGLFSGCSLFELPGEAPAGKPNATPTPSAAAAKYTAGDKIFSLNYSSKYGINPLNSLNKVNQTVASIVYEGLFTLDDGFGFSPVLCEDWWTTDGLYFTFKLKDGITFHDGSSLTASDVVYSINQAKKTAAYGSRFTTIAGISAADSKTLSIRLSKVNMLFPALLDVPIIKSGSVGEKDPVGTGPYALSSKEDYQYLQAYKDWRNYDKLPIKDIYLQEYDADNVISAFEGGYLDLVCTDPTDVSSVNLGGNCEIHYYDTTYLQYLGFRMSSGFFSMADARLAVSSAIDRSYIATAVMSYSAKEAHIPTLREKEALSKFDGKKTGSEGTAKGILIAGGISDYNNDGWLEYKSGGVPVKFTIRFIANKDNPIKLAAAKSIAETLIKLGINIDFQPLSWNDYVTALEKGDFDMYYAEVKLKGDFDLSELLLSEGSLNYGGIKDEGYRALIDAYYAATDELRSTAAEALYNDIASTAPIAPVVFRSQAMVTMRGVVTGAAPTPSSVFHKIENWKIDLG